MQQFYGAKLLVSLNKSGLFRSCLNFAFLIGIVFLTGCVDRPSTIDPVPTRPFAGTRLKIGISDPSDRPLIEGLIHSWALRHGAQFEIVEGDWGDQVDIGILRPAELVPRAETLQLAELPKDIRSSTNAYHWDDLVTHTPKLLSWKDKYLALPIVGEGMVLAYRHDAFDGNNGHPAAPPRTWEEMADFGKGAGEGSLPPLPTDPDQNVAEFSLAAASYDSLATYRIISGTTIKDEFFSFLFDMKTGEPRLNSPAFRQAANLFTQMKKYRSIEGNRVEAFTKGKAKLGLVSLAELGQITTQMEGKIGVAAVPGAPFTFDAKGNRVPLPGGNVNRIPYIGWGGRIGVVSAKSAHSEAAWNFLIECGNPDQTALDLISNPRWGAGPYRMTQIDVRQRSRWLGYHLNSAETDRLISVLRDNLGISTQNTRFALRTPNQAPLVRSLDQELRKLGGVSGDQAMETANSQWKAAISTMKPEEWKLLLRRSLGL
jgi:hypothetical protein